MKKIVSVLAVVLSAAGLAACGGSNTAPSGGSGGSGGSAGKGGGSAIFTTIDETHQITSGAPMNPYNASGNSFGTYDQIALGYNANNSLNPNESYPGIASSWTLQSHGDLLVHIQPNAGWSDGKPVTATDIKTSAAIAFAEGTQPSNLQSVKVMGTKEISFIPKPGSTNQLFTSEALQTIVVPSFEYDAELPSNVWSTIAASLKTGAAAKKAQTALAALGKKIDGFSPKTDISAGPFYIERFNSGEALLGRNTHFFAASKIAPKQVIVRNYTGNAEIWQYLEGGELSFAPYTSMPTNVRNRILAASGNKESDALTYVGAALAFNEKDYPYGITKVRQALAYLLNRTEITKVAESVSGNAAKTQTGMIDSIVPSWLTSAQSAKLNPYDYSPSKATALLTSAGFKKKGGQWYEPNGKPWSLTIEAVNGFSDWIAADSYMTKQLSAFGIKASSAIAADYPTYLSNIAHGDYPIGFWLNALGPAIYNAYARVWGSNVNAVGSTPSPTKGNFLHTPATYDVAGVGTINPNTLTESLPNLSTAQAKPVVAKLAAAYSQELPMITLWNYRTVQFYNDTHFTDFPTAQGYLNQAPGLWMWSGFVHAR